MAEIEDCYLQGERAMIVFNAHLKDEPRTFEKAKLGKTRVFSAMPLDGLLVMRKFTMSIVRLLQNNRIICELCPGLNCHSKDWGVVYRHLIQFGTTQMVAGDYKAFDKMMPAEFILAAFQIVIRICVISGNYDDEDVMCLRGIMTDIVYPITNLNGDLVQFHDLNSSGHGLTVIINGLVNSLYMRYTYYVLNPAKEVASFKKNVALLTYGDDNVLGVSKRVPWYNHTTIRDELAKHSIVYTMPDKTSESVPYVDISTVSFLKRYWVYMSELDDMACPLEMESIEKSLTVWVASGNMLPEVQTIESFRGALREYFYWGREKFEEMYDFFTKVILEEGLTDYLLEPLPTFDELVNVWKAH
jgi:hypothetical protein